MGYFLRRLSFYLVALLVAATLNFIIPRAMPGDPVTMMFANASVQVTPERIAAMKELLGFVDGPIYIQYLSYIKNILSWELGTSIQFYPLSVNSLLGGAFGWSLFLAGTAVVLSFSIASVLGIFAAWKRGSRYDAFVTPGTLIIQAIPQMVIAMLALFIFAIGLKWFPSGYAYTPGTERSSRSVVTDLPEMPAWNSTQLIVGARPTNRNCCSASRKMMTSPMT